MLGDTEANIATTDLENEYEILGELGRGATAVVYRARDRELGREVAIKVIRPKYADDDETVARLAREARTVAQLQHPNIVTLYAVRRVRDGSLALVMQLVPGHTLRELLNDRGACSFERTDRILRDVASALAHAHERGIVHRDVKPENIFIDETTGHALLSDFGVARSLEPDSRLTATGTAIGTPAYMAPEQIDGTELDGRSDLYSLGLVGWEMLTGQRPWEGEGLYSVIYKQKREDLPPADELRPGTPDRLIYLIEGATRKDPAERWGSAAELLEHASTISPEGGWSRWHAERRKRRRAMVYSAARDRGDSILSAALETVRFRRDAAGRLTPDTGRRPQQAGADVSEAAEASPLFPAREAPRRKRSPIVPVVVVTTLVLATAAASLFVIRGRTTPLPEPRQTGPLADNGSVEVPITTPPNAGAGATPATAAPASTEGLPPAAANADSLSALATAREPRDSIAVTPPSPSASTDATPPERTAQKPAEPTRRETRAEQSTRAAPAPSETRAPASQTASSGSALAAKPKPIVAKTGDSALPLPAPPPVATASVSFPAERGTVAAGGRHSCELDASGAASCWGANDQGQLGDGTHDDHEEPTVVAGGLTFAQLSAGASHTCAVTRDGDVYCWGNNERGQLGDATTLERDTPVRVGAAGPFRIVRAGFSHSCALARSGEISCWGSNAYGQLGSGSGLTSTRPAAVAGDLRFGAIAVGWNHTCAITAGGDLFCWGSNNAGQIGDGTHDDRRLPTRVSAGAKFVAVAAGNQHTCAVSTTGDVYCWGRNNYGQLATGAGDRAQPTRVEADGEFATVTAGAVHTCARTTSGQVFCWGRNTFGQLGDGTTTDRQAPVRVVGLPAVAAVQATGAHTCAATSGGDNFCWGYNVEGQLGDGTRTHRSRPVRVSRPSR